MNLSKEQFLQAIKNIFTECHSVVVRKNNDYAGNTDPLANFRTFGWKGVVVRLSDKMSRLVTFYNKPELSVKDESIEDTLQDLINYAAICLVMYRLENNNTPPFSMPEFNKVNNDYYIDVNKGRIPISSISARGL